jgi:hypothetical protein
MSEPRENGAQQQPSRDAANTAERPGVTLVDMKLPTDEPEATRSGIRAAFTAPASGPAVSTATPEATAAAPGTGARLAEPLLHDAAGLRSQWQRVQGSFVDDPQAAVGDAADLVEQTAQAIVGALRQRQRELRAEWDRSPAGSAQSNPARGAVPDTEHLRVLMQRYRALFNQLCRS